MLQTKLTWTTSDGAESTLYLDIANVSRKRFSDYRLELYNEARDSVKSDQLVAYPRWSEPTLTLVARGLDRLYPATGLHPEMNLPDQGITRLTLVLKLISGVRDYQRELDSITVSAGTVEHCSELNVLTAVPFALTDEDTNPCHVAQRIICFVLFGTPNLPAYPEAFNPSIHENSGRKFIRLDEIPEPARTAFSGSLMGSTVPCIAGEDDDNIAYPWDWNSFAGN